MMPPLGPSLNRPMHPDGHSRHRTSPANRHSIAAALKRCALKVAVVCIGGIHVTAAPIAAAPGQAGYQLDVDDDLISLSANDASLSAIIEDLEEALGVSIKLTTEPPRTVSGTFTEVSLQRLLFSMGVNYTLYYKKDGPSGAVHLTRGGISPRAVPRHTPDPSGPDNRSLRPGKDTGASKTDERQESSAESGDSMRYADSMRYTVVKGDTLERLAKLFIVPVETLAARNGIDIDAQLQLGQTLLIPPSPL